MALGLGGEAVPVPGTVRACSRSSRARMCWDKGNTGLLVELGVFEFLDEFFFFLFHAGEFFFFLETGALFFQDLFLEGGADLLFAQFLKCEKLRHHFALFAFDGFAFLLLDFFALAALF